MLQHRSGFASGAGAHADRRPDRREIPLDLNVRPEERGHSGGEGWIARKVMIRAGETVVVGGDDGLHRRLLAGGTGGRPLLNVAPHHAKAETGEQDSGGRTEHWREGLGRHWTAAGPLGAPSIYSTLPLYAGERNAALEF